MSTKKILERVRALLAHADSADKIGSQAEAEAFAAKAADLLARHKLSMSEVDLAAQDDAEPVAQEYVDTSEYIDVIKRGGRRRVVWSEQLLSALAAGHFCRIMVMPGSSRLVLCGRESDRQVVLYLYGVLGNTCERLARKHERVVRVAAANEGRPMPYAPKRSFQLGFALGVRDRLRAARKDLRKDTGEAGLIVLDNADRDVAAFVDARTDGKVKSSAGIDGASHEAGRSAGRKANMGRGIGGGTAGSAQKLIGGG